jgi:Predicted oxidoreductases (related to aryl-alcohol dehydrogenases)
MIYRPFGNTGIISSAIGLGTWNIGNQWGEIDSATAYATIHSALDEGVTLIDTAESYGIPNGLSEERVGQALTGIRHKAILVTKIGNWNKGNGGVPLINNDMFRLCCHASLYRLRTDYIDVYLCHLDQLEADKTDIWLDGLEHLKQRGLIRCYGISTNSLEVLKRFNKNNTCSAVEVEYSLVDRSAEDGLLDYAHEHGMGVLVRGPLAKGVLSGQYTRESVFDDNVRANWNNSEGGRRNYSWRMDRLDKILQTIPREGLAETAIRFTASHPAMPVAIPGAKSPEQAAANARVGDYLFSADELRRFKGI